MSILPHQCGCPCHVGGHCSGHCCDRVGEESAVEKAARAADMHAGETLATKIEEMLRDGRDLTMFMEAFPKWATDFAEQPSAVSTLAEVSRILEELKNRVQAELVEMDKKSEEANQVEKDRELIAASERLSENNERTIRLYPF
jgi:hypothetical protein